MTTMTQTQRIEAIYPLSSAQQGILFHSLNAREPGLYFLQYSYTLEGCLDPRAFELAWRTVMGRHPVLRTAFSWQELERPLQVVFEQVALPFVWQDWTARSPEEQSRGLDQYLAADRKQGFDLSKAPLIRVAVFQLSAGR